jgi:YggT family protein
MSRNGRFGASRPCRARLWPVLLCLDYRRGEDFMIELLGFISYLITLYIYIIIAAALLSVLMAFNVVNPYNNVVRAIYNGLNAVTEPVLRPIRRLLPDTGGIDFSPLVLILFLMFVQSVVLPNIAKLVIGP